MIKVSDRFNAYKDMNDIYIYDKKENKVIMKIRLEFFSFVHQFTHQFDEDNKRTEFAVCKKENGKYPLYLYEMDGTLIGWVANLIGGYEESYLGNDCFKTNNNMIISLKTYNKFGPFDKIIKDPDDENSELVLVTKNIVNVDAGLVEEMSFLFNLKNEKIEGTIGTKHQSTDVELMSKSQADKFNALYHVPEEERYHIKDINLMLLSDYVGTATLRFGVVKPFESLCESKTNPDTVVNEQNETLFLKMKVKRLKTIDGEK